MASPAQAEALVRAAEGQEVFLDLETRGLDPWHPDSYIAGAAVLVPGLEPLYLPIAHPESANLPLEALVDLVCTAGSVSNHNRRFDLKFLAAHAGVHAMPPGRDSMTAMTLENENQMGPGGRRKGAYALKHRARVRFGAEAVAAEAELTALMTARRWDPKADLYRLTAAEIAPYACDDVRLVERCFREWLDPRLAALGLEDLAREYYAYDELLLDMEIDGLHLDREIVERELARNLAEAPRYREEIQRQAADSLPLPADRINPASPIQMRTWLNLPDTAAWRLRADGSPEARLLLTYRQWAMARGTYWEPYLSHSDANGTLRPHFWYTRTGRLTCFDPNLHATPHEEKSPAYTMKRAFVAPPGHFLLYADWSQAEMRLCAHYTQDADLMHAFATGVDIHTMVAAMLGCDRQTAKPLNYGSAYGMGPAKLAREYGMGETEATRWLKKYHATLVGPRSLYRRMESLARAQGWIRLWDGRYRRFSLDPAVEAFPHSASNSLLQGGVGAMARRAMLMLRDWCYGHGGRMWIQIHDAILFCLPLEMRHAGTYAHVRRVMESFDFRVPMTVEMGQGQSWSEAAHNPVPRRV